MCNVALQDRGESKAVQLSVEVRDMKSLLVAVFLGAAVFVSAGAVQAGTLGIPSGISGALPSPYLTVADQEMVVTGTAVNLRAKPATNGKVLAKLNSGTKVMVMGTSGSWSHVKYKTMDGYISTRFLK
jgi:uncharacterized protein YgiM (DUF1202 family)